MSDDEQGQKIALIERDIIGITRDIARLISQIGRNEVIVDELKKEFNTMKTDVTIVREKMESIFKFLWIIIAALVTIGIAILIAIINQLNGGI